MTIVIILIIISILLFLYFKFFKIPKLKTITFIDGSLGTGKSNLSVALAIRVHKRKLRVYKYWQKFLPKRFRPFKEEPILYSNIALRNIKFCLVNADLLQRKNYRFAYKSTILLDEYSLIADQMLFGKKYEDLTERLNEFWKLLRHEMRGGHCFVNSQSTSDLHYTLKSVISDYFYIHHSSGRFMPFIKIFKVQECRFSRDNSSLNVNIEDVEENLKTMIILKKYYKYYDTYCYSVFTDNLPIYKKVEERSKYDSLKVLDICSYKDMKFLKENLKVKHFDVGSYKAQSASEYTSTCVTEGVKENEEIRKTA